MALNIMFFKKLHFWWMSSFFTPSGHLNKTLRNSWNPLFQLAFGIRILDCSLSISFRWKLIGPSTNERYRESAEFLCYECPWIFYYYFYRFKNVDNPFVFGKTVLEIYVNYWFFSLCFCMPNLFKLNTSPWVRTVLSNFIVFASVFYGNI